MLYCMACTVLLLDCVEERGDIVAMVVVTGVVCGGGGGGVWREGYYLISYALYALARLM
jgi:hypothetical protein